MSVLVLAEIDNDTLSATTARAVAAARQLGPVDLFVPGGDAAARAGAALAGVTRVLQGPAGDLADDLAARLKDMASGYEYLVAAATTLGRDVMPRLAALLDIQPVTDIVTIETPTRFVRPIYAGNALETLSDPQPMHVLTVRPSAFAPVASDNNAPIEQLGGSVASLARFIAAHRTESDVPDLATARIVVGGGIAIGSAEGFHLIERLAGALGAAVGATRAAVDAGYAPNDWQVGQTGKIIAPDLYIAVGISGALQHLAGIQGAKTILAINTDPEAPIVKIADRALIGDLFTVVPELIDALERRGVKPA